MNDMTAMKGNGSVGTGNITSWLFGSLVLAIGIINTFWGNDPFFGYFLVLLSFIYFLPVNDILRKTIGFSIPKMRVVKIVLGILITWTAIGVGELFDKIGLMLLGLK